MIRQRFEKDTKTKTKYLVFSVIDAHKDVIATLPSAELRLPILKTTSGELVKTPKIQGFNQGKEAEEWFTAFLGRPVLVLRAAPEFFKAVPKHVLKQSLDVDKT